MKLILSLVMLVGALFGSVDINKADAKSLTSLKGIGMKKAKAIVAYRDTNGCFSNKVELTKIKGIGMKIIEKNRADIIVGECKK